MTRDLNRWMVVERSEKTGRVVAVVKRGFGSSEAAAAFARDWKLTRAGRVVWSDREVNILDPAAHTLDPLEKDEGGADMKRYALVRNARSQNEVERYLPGNYSVAGELIERPQRFIDAGAPAPKSDQRVFVIEGEDDHGWSLDGYVIPRFYSGTIYVEEIDLSHPAMKQVPV